MRRASLAIALALAGCMRIYPDPELPDIELEWYDGSCREGIGDVHAVLSGIDDPALHFEATVPCATAIVAFPDVDRAHYHVDATLLDTAGAEFATWYDEVDVRNGVDVRSSMYFGDGGNLRVGWTFEDGESCESLDVDLVMAYFTPQRPPFEPWDYPVPCRAHAVFASLPEGDFTVRLVAQDKRMGTAVAASAESPVFTVAPEPAFTNVGNLVLARCGDACP